MQRRTQLVVLAGMAVVGAAGAVALWSRADRITRENFARLNTGMSRAEVEAILGPPGDYTTSPPGDMGEEIVRDTETGERDAPGVDGLLWIADAGIIEVTFDRAGQACRTVFAPLAPAKQSRIDNLLWRARRQWRRWFP
jgi:hypothetical protein